MSYNHTSVSDSSWGKRFDVKSIITVVRQLYINTDSWDKYSQEFLRKKITNKLLTQIQDPLVLSSASLPTWVEELTYTPPFIFPFKPRQLFFHCTAFESTRSIVWLEQQRELEQRGKNGPGLDLLQDTILVDISWRSIRKLEISS